ncbi:Chaperone protein DnaK, partial [Bathymodiolus thermophilus thioautotrophic gill symbiont]
KRLIGRRFDEEAVQKDIDLVPTLLGNVYQA